MTTASSSCATGATPPSTSPAGTSSRMQLAGSAQQRRPAGGRARRRHPRARRDLHREQDRDAGGCAPDATLASTGFGLYLENPAGELVDAVGVYPNEPWPTTSECTLGQNLPNLLDAAANESYQRVGAGFHDYVVAPAMLGAENRTTPDAARAVRDRDLRAQRIRARWPRGRLHRAREHGWPSRRPERLGPLAVHRDRAPRHSSAAGHDRRRHRAAPGRALGGGRGRLRGCRRDVHRAPRGRAVRRIAA